MKVLIVDDDPGTLDFLSSLAEGANHDVRIAEDGVKGLETFREFDPDVILTDIQMPNMDGLQMLEVIRAENSNVIAIIITAFGSEHAAAQALRLGANDYINKPIKPRQFEALLGKYTSLVGTRRRAPEIPKMITQRSFSIQLDNRIELIPEAADYLVSKTTNVLNEEDRLGVHLGLYELLINAVEHGNFEIGGEEKAAAMSEHGQQGLVDLYENRRTDPRFSLRRVTVDYNMGEEKCEWIITDEGNGFSFMGIKDPTDTDGLATPTGRGIYLSRFQFDELEYLGKGNSVRACKYIKKKKV